MNVYNDVAYLSTNVLWDFPESEVGRVVKVRSMGSTVVDQAPLTYWIDCLTSSSALNTDSYSYKIFYLNWLVSNDDQRR